MLAGGQGKLKGRIFRLGHLGSVTTDEILAAIGVIEAVAVEQGLDVEPGAAVAAAQRALRRGHDRRRGARVRILVVEPLAAEGLELLRAHHDVDEKLGLAQRGDRGDPARSTTRSSSAARSRSTPS